MSFVPSSDNKSSSADAEAPLAHRVVRGGLWLTMSSYFNVGFGFLANLALTRILAPEDFGVFALAAFLFALINIRPKVGIGYAFAQRKETTGELVGTHFALDVTAGLFTLLIAIAAIPLLSIFGYSQSVIWTMLALAGVGISDSITTTATVLLDKGLYFGRTSVISTLVFPLSYVPAFWLALHGGGYWSLVVQTATYALLLLVTMWWAAHRWLPNVLELHWKFDFHVARGLVSFGGVVGLAALAVMLTTQFDNFLVGTFVGIATLGLYDRAYRIAQWPSLLVNGAVTRAAFYTYARLQDDATRLQKALTMILWLITTAALPLSLAIFVSGPDLVALIYGERWRASAIFLRFLVVYSLLRPFMDNAGSLFVAVGQLKKNFVIVAAHAATLISIATPLTLVYGAVGTCVGVGIAFTVGLVFIYWYMRETVALSIVRTLLVPTTSAVAVLLIYLVFSRSVDLNLLPLAIRVIVKAGFAVGAFYIIMLALHPRQFIESSSYVLRLLKARG